MDLNSELKSLGRVYKMYSGRLEKLGIKTPWDLLLHVPNRYDNFSLVSKIENIQPGEIVTIKGKVENISNSYTRRWKNLQKALVVDETGEINVLWFNQPYLAKNIKIGDTIALSGKASSDKGKLLFVSPDYEIIGDGEEQIHTGRLVPVYPETRGITSKWIRRQVYKFLKILPDNLADVLPEEISSQENLLPLRKAILGIHFPHNLQEAEKAKERIAFEELFLLHLKSKIKRQEWEKEIKGNSFKIYEEKLNQFIKSLPFKLTTAQEKALLEIKKDLEKEVPMNRLLQGDVGSGKTILAASAMYLAYLNGYKSSLMAPTEILANQHFQTIKSLLEPLGIRIELITSSQKNNKNQEPEADISIGTHALLFKGPQKKDLGLVIIDEQQRFGVKQRSLIRKKGNNPHFLSLTATPIPRTVALAAYGDLDVSYLFEMPKGRIPIRTWLVPEEKRDSAYSWIEKEIKKNKTQAFIICPFIEESETMKTVKAASVEFEKLKKVFKELRLGLLHGKIKTKEKEKIMQDFKNGKFDILVATPLVEVGIDIPNATIIVIEGGERFGLSQLHQLRGRVGRNNAQSYCLIFTDAKNPQAIARLKGMETIQNGAELAELDLKLRGAGDIFGTLQHGELNLKVASFSDFKLIERTMTQAEKILPKLSKYPKLTQEIEKINSSQEISPD